MVACKCFSLICTDARDTPLVTGIAAQKHASATRGGAKAALQAPDATNAWLAVVRKKERSKKTG